MALPRRVALAQAGLAAGVGLLIAVAAVPAMTGSAAAATSTGGCQAAARIDTQWGSGPTGGEVLSVTVVNTATTAATTWSVAWTLPSGQQITNAWNATVNTSSGIVTAVNTSWNGTLAPGASTSFGMQLAGTGPAPALSCGNDAVPPPSTPPVSSSASNTPPGPGDVNLGEADSRTTVNLVVGQTLGVSLPGNYKPFTSSDPAMSLLSSSGGYPAGQPLSELFRAVGIGSLDLSTETDAPCFHTTPPCAMPVHQWIVHVNVARAPTPGDVTIGETANQTTVTLYLGQTLGVSLPAEYRPLTSTTGPLILLSQSGGDPTGQPLNALFRAVNVGSTTLHTEFDFPCTHDPTPCPGPYRPWTVNVTVLNAPPHT
ncbi:cellulose binding domain-containing protein [Actinoplanes sp. NPDC026623]|uniref:cellulose binding domain-containing protein n=1 Tax=Actinoplanes sp. NPDC026623 TaxID=3155610 RepID=UPI0033F4AB44